MNHRKNLMDYAEKLVRINGKYGHDDYTLFLGDLADDEQCELARLYVEYCDRETTECVHGKDFSIDNNYTCALLALLHKNCEETRNRFADVTRENILSYYGESLQRTLDEACSSYFIDNMKDAGFYSAQCPESGDIYWSRH